MASAAVQSTTLIQSSDASPRLTILAPTVPGAVGPVTPVQDTYTEDEAKALYREGIEFLREMAANSPSATARSQAAAKLAQFFVNAANRQRPRTKVRISFIDPRQLVDEAPEDFIA